MSNNGGTLEKFAGSLSQLIQQEYHIGEEYYRGDVKRGLAIPPKGLFQQLAGHVFADAENAGETEETDE